MRRSIHIQVREREREREVNELKSDEEVEERRQRKEKVVTKVRSEKRGWRVKEELKMSPGANSPLSKAVATFIAFLVSGFIPLLAYVLDYASNFRYDPFTASCVLTALALTGIGLLKSYVVELPLWRGASETLLLGGSAAGLAYIAGNLLEKMF